MDIPLTYIQMYTQCTHKHMHAYFLSIEVYFKWIFPVYGIGLQHANKSCTHTDRERRKENEMFNIEHVNEEIRERLTESNICTDRPWHWHMPYVTLSYIKKKMLLTFLIYTESAAFVSYFNVFRIIAVAGRIKAKHRNRSHTI